jgi:hypothetical protein
MPNEFEKKQGILYAFREEDGNHILIIKDSQIQLFTIATKNPILLHGVIDVEINQNKKEFWIGMI